MNRGVNYFDMAASEAKPYASYARAFENRRREILLQMHFGAVYDNGKYGWTRNLDKVKGHSKVSWVYFILTIPIWDLFTALMK